MQRTHRKIGRALAVVLAMALLLSTFVFAAPNASAASADDSSMPFTDVEAGSWYEPYVLQAYQDGLMNGTGTNTFNPDGQVTRSEIVTTLYRLAGQPDVTDYSVPFTDISTDLAGEGFYYNALLWAYNVNLTKGTGENQFAPSQILTRAELFTFLYRYDQIVLGESYDGTDAVLEGYTDVADIPALDDFVTAMSWAVSTGLCTSTSSYVLALSPTATCTREELATVLVRMEGLIEANETTGFAALPAGQYTYVSETPTAEAGSGSGEVEYVFETNTLNWAYGDEDAVLTGSEVLTGDEMIFFLTAYLSNQPLYDWLASNSRDTEGYEGNLDGYFLITFNDEGKISALRVDNGITNVKVIVSKDIVADTLEVSGAVRGQPNLLQSSITLLGSTNGLYLTDRGNVILNELQIGHDENGIGLTSDKIGGDTFLVNTVAVDGIIHWYSRYANLQPIHDGSTATLMTYGQDIIMEGCNIGRMRELNITTGEGGGDIIIGQTVSVDYGRQDPLDDASTGTLTLSTTGSITAGTGDVIIGTNDYAVVKIDQVGDIQGNNVTIMPTDNGTITDVSQNIGSITAAGDIYIEVGNVNSEYAADTVFGDMTAGGDITVIAGAVNGYLGNISAPNGTVTLDIANAYGVGEVTGQTVDQTVGEPAESASVDAVPCAHTIQVDGTTMNFDAYTVEGETYIQIWDLAYAFLNTDKQFYLDWNGLRQGIVTINSGGSYTPKGTEMAGVGTETKSALISSMSLYLDLSYVSCGVCKIDDTFYFSLTDLAKDLDFGLSVNNTTKTIQISTTDSYVENEDTDDTETETATGFAALPAGQYTYVRETPTAEVGSGTGEVQYVFTTNTLNWAYGDEDAVLTGSEVLTGDEMTFFLTAYLSDQPLYDWLASNSRDTEGYEGNLDGYFLITFNDEGKISALRVGNGITNVKVIVNKDIVAETLEVSGAVRGQPNLLQSSITLLGSTNGLYLTDRGNVILNELEIGHDEDGIGLTSDKIGGDTFLVNTVAVDGIIHWYSHYANLQPIQDGTTATLMTYGQDIIMEGANIGRMRELNITTGEGGGDIIIGETVSVTYGRQDPLDDPSTGTLTLSTTGTISAGTGDVVIGTNDYAVVSIDQIGDIQGNNVTIMPTDNGTITNVSQNIGSITAAGDITIKIGNMNAEYSSANTVLGDLTAGGDITITAGDVNGLLSNVTADGSVTLNIGSAYGIGTVTGETVVQNIGEPEETGVEAVPCAYTIQVDGTAMNFDAYTIEEDTYIQIFDLAYAFMNTDKDFYLSWTGTSQGIVTINTGDGQSYTSNGNEMAGVGSETKSALASSLSIYLNSTSVSAGVYKIDDTFYFSLSDLANLLDFGLTVDDQAQIIQISTTDSYEA